MSESGVKERTWRRLRRWLPELLILLLILGGVHLWQTRELPHGPAPSLAGELLDGGRFDLETLRGHVVLVHFWGSWCPVCRFEADTIAAIARGHEVVGVAVGEDAGQVRRYFEQAGLRYPVIPDPDGRLRRVWKVRGVPASFIIDRRGEIRFRSVGYTTRPGLEIRLWLADILSR